MRVIAGYLKGRTFDSVSGYRTHPMSEKIRGAMFNALGDIYGLTILDAYSGTGAIAIEAISRGAKSVMTIDVDPKAVKTIKKNIVDLKLEDKIDVTRAYAHAWLRRHPNSIFDITILDPPYDNVDPKDLINLSKSTRSGGTIVISLPPTSGFRLAESKYDLLSVKNYGDAELLFYRVL